MTQATEQLPLVDQLHVGALLVSSVDYDWSGHEHERDFETFPPCAHDMSLREKLELASDKGCWDDEFNPLDEDMAGLKKFIKDNELGDDWKEACPDSDDPDVVLEAMRAFVIDQIENGSTDFDEGALEDAVDNAITESEAYFPMMNYYYPVPDFRGDLHRAQAALSSLPLCIVKVGDEVALALTGGGMDLSWEICEAYMRLGYLPPFHFVRDLPKMAGMSFLHTTTKWVWEGAKRSCELVETWSKRAGERMDELKEWMLGRR